MGCVEGDTLGGSFVNATTYFLHASKFGHNLWVNGYSIVSF